FTLAEPAYRAEYDRIFRMPVTFSAGSNALLTDASWLEQQPGAPSRRVLEIVKERAGTMLQRLDDTASTRSRVEALLANRLQSNDVSVDDIACELGTSRHTLLRKLKAEGATF